MRVVVIGASSGLGRCIGIGLGEKGHQVALLARREDRLAGAVEEAGPGALAVKCDVTDELSCRQAIEEAAAGLGGIDALVYSTGIGTLTRIAETPADLWQQTFATNVTGASIATSAALPHLRESGGVAVYLSSVSASQSAPWPGLSTYIVSKAALEKLIDAWRIEHPQVGFTRVIVGDCAGGEGHSATEFANGWSQELAAEIMPLWVTRNLIAGNLMEVSQLVAAVDMVIGLGAGDSIPSIAVTPRHVA